MSVVWDRYMCHSPDDVAAARFEQREVAEQQRAERIAVGASGILIYLATQHPLVAAGASAGANAPRDRPGDEFRARIDRVVQLARRFSERKQEVLVVVSGNRHRDQHGVEDALSLREVAVRELTAADVPVVDGATVAKYRPNGVFCTEDEMAVVAGVYRAGERFRDVVGVCGQAQSMRVRVAAENEGLLMQIETPLVVDGTGQLVSPNAFWHQVDTETVKLVPGYLFPIDPSLLEELQAASRLQRKVV
jgi:hypothetical protein